MTAWICANCTPSVLVGQNGPIAEGLHHLRTKEINNFMGASNNWLWRGAMRVSFVRT